MFLKSVGKGQKPLIFSYFRPVSSLAVAGGNFFPASKDRHFFRLKFASIFCWTEFDDILFRSDIAEKKKIVCGRTY